MKVKYVPDIRFSEFSTDWNHHTLGDLIEISSASRVHKNEWTTSGVRFFRSSDVVANFKGKKNIPAFISNELYKSLSERSGVLQPDDLLVTGGGSIGIPYLVTDKEPLYFKDADLLWLKSANKIDGHFLYYYFLTPQLRKYILSVTHIGTISHYTIEQSKATPIILPDVVEQTKIGKFFKKLDSTIARQEQELATLKQTKQGFLQKMFPKEGESVPDLRFPGFTENWKNFMLSDVATFINGRAYKQQELLNSGKYKVLRVGNFYTNNTWYYSDLELGEKYYADTGDLLYTWSASFGPHIWQGDKVIYHYHIWKVELKSGFDKQFAVQLLEYDKAKILNDKNGSTMVHITKKGMEEKRVLLPSIEEQIQIGKFLKQLEDVITIHQQELDILKQTKKAFLQKMFV